MVSSALARFLGLVNDGMVKLPLGKFKHVVLALRYKPLSQQYKHK
jgi:hypothetical protein